MNIDPYVDDFSYNFSPFGLNLKMAYILIFDIDLKILFILLIEKILSERR